MKKSLMFLLLSFVCLSVSAQSGKIRSGVIAGVSMDWYKDKAVSNDRLGFNVPDMKPSFHVGYQFQFYLMHRLSVDAALLYGQKRGEMASIGYEVVPVEGYKSKFTRNYIALNGVVNYNLIGGLKIGAGIEPTIHFKEDIMIENKIKSAFDVPVVVKAAYAFKYFDLALMYKHGTCNVMKGVPFMKYGRTRDLQVSIFVPIFR
ncbi:hypothetical protein DWW90_02280 [Parabacteroides sp. AF17-28]|nr:hypothetical protein DWW90_02280 [Parabacteroides sp. AF17-28]